MTKDPSKKCHQHKESSGEHQNENPQSDQVTNVNIPNLVRCEGKTLTGIQCSKMTMDTNKRCHHHKESLSQPSVEQSTHSMSISDDHVTTTHAPPRPRRETRSMRSQTTRVVETLERLENQVREIENLARSRLMEARDEMRTERSELVIMNLDDQDVSKTKVTRMKKKKTGKEEKQTETSLDQNKTEDCCVCYDPVPQNEFLKCEHAVCKSCIAQLRDTRCPMCRAEIKSKNISEKEKKKMIRRRQEDYRNRNNELFNHYMQSQNQIYVSLLDEMIQT
jgi:hypothetical protein